MRLTTNDVNAIKLIKSNSINGSFTTRYSCFAFALYESEKYRWPQGMALAGAKVINRLVDAGYITKRASLHKMYILTLTSKADEINM